MEEFGERDQQLADIQSAVKNYEERGRTEREESAKRDGRLAYSSHALSGHDVSQPLPSQCPLLFFVLNMEGFAAAARCFASAALGRWRGAFDARQRLGSGRGVLYMPLAATYFLRFVYIFMVSYPHGYERSCRNDFSYPRGYDMTSTKTYSYPYSTNKRYPFSVRRKPVLEEWLSK
jgi:hypothetical protein